jgi:putative transcriptional regulator
MRVTKGYKSEAFAALHESVADLHEAGFVDKATMRHFDESCLTPMVVLTAEEIRQIRLRTGTSQSVFARYLNVTPGVVTQWERGIRRPAGPSLKLLHLVDKKGLEMIA